MVDAKDAVQKMQDYIASHLKEEISLQELARASMYSAWHAHRLFVDALRMGPAEYIRKLRLSASALELRDSKARVLDIALKYGFSSVDGYQRAFLKEFGCNPGTYAIFPMPIYLFIPYGVKIPAKKRVFRRSIAQKPQHLSPFSHSLLPDYSKSMPHPQARSKRG